MGRKAAEEQRNFVVSALAALREGRSIELSSTEPYGCGVKHGSGPSRGREE